MGKCLYCNRETDNSIMINGFDGFDKKEQIVFCCCSEHAEEINKYNSFANKNGKKFIAFMSLISISVCIMIPLAFMINNLIISLVIGFLPIILLGQLLIHYPFTTPTSTRKVGIKQSVTKAKKIGVLLQIVAVLLAIITYILIRIFI